jgi:hypothetical protein
MINQEPWPTPTGLPPPSGNLPDVYMPDISEVGTTLSEWAVQGWNTWISQGDLTNLIQIGVLVILVIAGLVMIIAKLRSL